MEQLKIAIISSHHPSERSLGVPHVVSRVSTYLASWGHHVEVLYPVPRHSPPVEEEWHGVVAHGIPDGHFRRLPFGPELDFSWNASRRLGRDLDVIISNNERGGALAMGRARRWKRARDGRSPLAVEILHGLNLRILQFGRLHRPPGLRQSLGFHADQMVLKWLEGSAARHADRCVVASTTVRDDLMRAYGVPAEKTHVIYNAVEPQPERTPSDREAAREALGLDPSKSYLSFVGHDIRRKGLAIAARAVKMLRSSGLDVELLNVGNDAPSSEGMRSFHWVDELTKRRVVIASDAFFFPTHYDTLPLAVLEAAAMGVPVVTTPGANLDMGHPGEDFILVRENTPDAHALALRELLANPAKLAAVGRAGRLALGTRSYEKQAREYLDLLKEGLDNTPSVTPVPHVVPVPTTP